MRPLTGFQMQAGLTPHLQPLPLNPSNNQTTLRVAKVTRVNADRGDVEIRIMEGEPTTAQALTSTSGTREGIWRMPHVRNVIPGDGPSHPLDSFGRTNVEDSYAIIGYANGEASNPIILGFLPSQQNELNGARALFIDRHHTDDVRIITEDGFVGDYANDFSGFTRTPGGAKDQAWDLDPNPGHAPEYHNYDSEDGGQTWVVHKTDDFALTWRQMSGKTRIKMDVDGNLFIQRDNHDVIQVHKDGAISITASKIHYVHAPIVTLDCEELHVTGKAYFHDELHGVDIQSPAGGVPGPRGPAGAPPAGEAPKAPHTANTVWKPNDM